MKNLIILLVCLSYSTCVVAQSDKQKSTKVSKAISKQIEVAINKWKKNTGNDFPDISAIINNEINASITASLDTEKRSPTKIISSKINLAVNEWKHHPETDFPDIRAIIQNEISSSIEKKLANQIDVDVEMSGKH